MRKQIYLISIITALGFGACSTSSEESKPNVIVIYADDLGFGDTGAYGSTELLTPNIDRLAESGIMLTNGYATSATCTPSRFGLLTGKYPWRNDKARILSGEAPALIRPGTPTLASLFKENGYATAVVGKWHLGLGSGNINWNKHISPGPNEIGFDYSYIMAATNDRVPTVYVENGNIVGLDPDDPIEVNYSKNFEGEPTGKENPELLKMHPSHGHNSSIVNGVSRIGFMKGGKDALWRDEDMADIFLEKAISYINENKNAPFFMFYALHQPHVPRVPHERFAGMSGLGPRGDVIVEADWCIGELINALEEFGLIENTFIIFSSDNGPVLDDGYHDEAVTSLGDHIPTGGLRGGKYSLFDAGTHVPFIVSWPSNIKPGTSEAIVSQVDLMASMASLLGVDNQAPDSENILDALTGKSENGREYVVTEGTNGKVALRKNNWVYIPPYKGAAISTWVNIELGNSSEKQLYNISEDPYQQTNLAEDFPEIVEEMKNYLENIRK